MIRRIFIFETGKEALGAWSDTLTDHSASGPDGQVFTEFRPANATTMETFSGGRRVSCESSLKAEPPSLSPALLDSLKNLKAAIEAAQKAVALWRHSV